MSDESHSTQDRKLKGFVLAGLILVTSTSLAAIVWGGKVGNVRDVEIHGADDTEARPEADQRKPLRVLVASMISPRSTLDVYGGLVKELGDLVGRRGVLVQRRNYTEGNEAIRHGDVDLAFICSGAYVQSEVEGGFAELLAVPVIQGLATYQAYIIVPRDKPWKELKDLRGQQAAYVDADSLTGRAYLRHRLVEMGERDDRFFKSIVYTGSHDRSIEAVARGIVDVATVDHLILDMMAEQQPELLDKIRIIERSQPYGAPPVVAPRGQDHELRASLKKALASIHTTEVGGKTLSRLRVDRFEAVPTSHYDSVRKIWEPVR